MFRDRTEAGIRLGEALKGYRGEDVIVLAIPCGGAEVGWQAAQALDCPFSLIISRKLPFPDNPESGFGAVSEDGSLWLLPGIEERMPAAIIERIKTRQIQEIARRITVLRKNRPLPDIGGKTVILVDDGIAMGSTMRASVACCRHKGAGGVVVASPVTGAATAKEMERIADDVVIVEIPRDFYAVAQVYRNWYDVPDEEVIRIMEKTEKERPEGSGRSEEGKS
ncbi:MAG: phosphoribosyltransferase [Proteobacteria bacterium]|nr:phosphoribosyltransferase [Pseudomonadota bacterium]